MRLGEQITELRREPAHLFLKRLSVIRRISYSDISSRSQDIILFGNVFRRYDSAESLLIFESSFRICVVSPGDFQYVIFSELAKLSCDHRTHIAGIYENSLSFLFLVPVQEPQRHRNSGGIEQLVRHGHDALDEVGFDDVLPDGAFAAAL